MKIKDFMEVADYRITETSEYLWQCYGPNALTIDSWNGGYSEDGYNVSVIFDTKNQTVYELSACDYARDRAYRWIHPNYEIAHAAECKFRGIADLAWDDVSYVNLDVEADILEKAAALVAGEDYDTRVMMSVEFSDADLLKYMSLAHEQDITFNKFVETALESAIAKYKLEGIL